jgi:hypothetical protein
MCLVGLFVVCFAGATWSTPSPERLWPVDLTAPPDNQSLSGKIASIGDATFSLEITKDQDKKTVKFVVDEETKVEGKLAVGSQATVEYRSDNGVNLVVRVVVTPASGVNSY